MATAKQPLSTSPLPQPSPAQPLPPPHHPQPAPTPSPKQQLPQQQTQQPAQQQKQQPQQQRPLSITGPNHPLNIADYQLLNSYPSPVHAYPELPYLVYPDPYAYQPMSTIPPPALHSHSHPVRNPIPPTGKNTNHNNKGKNGIEDKQYGQLQSSLIESGFSIKRLLEVFSWLPVSSGILQVLLIFIFSNLFSFFC